MSKQAQRGFTLFELLVVVSILGLVAVTVSTAMQETASHGLRYYNEKAKLGNQMIKDGLLGYAGDENFANKGVVPAPYTGAGYVSTVYNPADATPAGVALAAALKESGVALNEVNDDGKATPSVRVYQLVSNLVQTASLDGPGSATVDLRYQVGAIYQTTCNKAAASCNPNPATGIPGASPVLTLTNHSTWKTAGSDGDPTVFSTLRLQKIMLAETVRRLNTIQDKAHGYFNAMLIKTAAGDATNFYPAGTPSLAGASPGTNQGCRDGWYPLNSGDVLATMGLSASEFGSTKWGGVVEYCRDYDPTGTKLPDATPHFAAIRIHRNVSQALAPDPAVIGNNVILTI